ncbi:hypothetical protein BE20_20130 [Sorangium cellulosum]|nr:hypothetical protein BE20_20130 [Sorangium cellulosum]
MPTTAISRALTAIYTARALRIDILSRQATEAVVHDVAGREMAGEAAARPGRAPLGAQQGDQEQLAADADAARLEQPRRPRRAHPQSAHMS